MLLQSLYFSRFLPNRPRPLSSFDTHARWQPVTQSARSRRSYGKIEDCEQSTRRLKQEPKKAAAPHRLEEEMTHVAFYVVRISDIKRETNQLVTSSFKNESPNITKVSMNYCSNHTTDDCKQGDDSNIITTTITLHNGSPYVDLLSCQILKCHKSNIVPSPFC